MDLLTLSPAAPYHRGGYMRPISTFHDSPSTTESSSPDLTHDTTDDQGVTPDSEEEAITPDTVIVPKIEEQDDHHALAGLSIDAKPAIFTTIQHHLQSQPHLFDQPQPVNAPRKRGRPRKYPIVEQKKTTHARSKTGCGTCRKRKKKCDETKPSCMNCEKNNVVCDGYEPRQPWRPGKQKVVSQRLTIPAELPLLIDGIECDVDRTFFDHFTKVLSKRLSLTDKGNPFLKIIVPMSFEYGALMHSVLYLAGTCLLASSGEDNVEWRNRFVYHSDKAVSKLREGILQTIQDDRVGSQEQQVTSARFNLSMAQTLILCLQTVCEGNTEGSHRIHLIAMKRMLAMQKGSLPSEELREFVLEFLLYHDHSDSITNLKHSYDPRSIALMDDFRLPEYLISPQAGNLLGVFDGIFGYISRIRRLRDAVRQKRNAGQVMMSWWQDADITEEAFAIDKALREWQSIHPEGTSRHTASMLYRLCTWIYLERTIQISQPSPLLHMAVNNGLDYLQQIAWSEDSMPSILLMPLFLLGVAAFDPNQRLAISENLERLQAWSKLGNIKEARSVVEDIWRKMDAGLEQESWDWEQLMLDQDKDFLIT